MLSVNRHSLLTDTARGSRYSQWFSPDLSIYVCFSADCRRPADDSCSLCPDCGCT